MLKKHGTHGKGAFGTLVSLAIVALVFYSAFKVIPIMVNTYKFGEHAESAARLIGAQQSITEDDVRAKLMEQVRSAGLPIRENDISVQLNKDLIKVDIRYVVPIKLLGYTYMLKREYSYSGNRYRF